MQPEFDVIVVGAGPAGSACGITLARKGADVLILEKARIPGERNMTGGVLYGTSKGGYGMLDLIPDFETDAPVQRRITSHEVVVLSNPDWERRRYRYYRLDRNSLPARLGLFNLGLESGHDYSVLRRDFDQWFAGRAVQEGAMLSTQTTVEALIKEGDSFVGVRTAHEDIHAKLVIDTSGVASNLVEMAGLREKLVPSQVYHGLKHVFKLDSGVIEERFHLAKGEGKALLCLGDVMRGVSGGAFIYTNNDTLSVGIVVSMASMIEAYTEHFEQTGKTIDVLEAFESHPMIAGMLQGAEMVEYSAHNVPKGYKCILRKPFAAGYLAAGDALGSFVKVGPLLDGMRQAIATGVMAAETYVEASGSGSFGERALSGYRERLAPVYRDVARSRRDSLVNESRFVYNLLPSLMFSSSLFSKTGEIAPGLRMEPEKNAVNRVQAGTSLLNYDEDKVYSHITVDLERASSSPLKPWVPCCPVNCYTLVTPRGVFVSYKDLFDDNVRALQNATAGARIDKGLEARARSNTLTEISHGQVRFDHVACVACGTCGEIGPKDTVLFGHERDGHGVRYRYG